MVGVQGGFEAVITSQAQPAGQEGDTGAVGEIPAVNSSARGGVMDGGD